MNDSEREMLIREIKRYARGKNYNSKGRISSPQIKLAGEAECILRGGTAFTPVIEYVNNERKYRKSLLIYFTDGMGEESIPYPQVFRMLWVLPNDTGRPGGAFLKGHEREMLSVQEPYGDVICMDVD